MDLARVGLLHDAATGSEPVAVLREAWTAVLRYDYEPVFRPALNVLEALAAADAQGGVNQAVRAVAAWAKENAETYVSMGMEYAGELFSRVLGNQASDGEELRVGLHAGRDGNASAGQGPVPRLEQHSRASPVAQHAHEDADVPELVSGATRVGPRAGIAR